MVSGKNYSSRGFVIGRKKVKEADRIIILFTKDLGKVALVAKSVRKPISRKRGGLEMFSQIKFSAVKSHGLDIITEVEVLNSYNMIRNNLKKVSLAYYFCEVIGRVTRDGEKHEPVYEILERCFSNLIHSNKLKDLRLKFIGDVLTSLGFWPHDKPLVNPDLVLEGVIERKISSVRVGRKMLQQD